MKTTIEIPEGLYKKAKIRAIERGQTLKQIVLTSLQRELSLADEVPAIHPSPWATRKLLPAFAHLQANGAFRSKLGDRDISQIISEDREDRPL